MCKRGVGSGRRTCGLSAIWRGGLEDGEEFGVVRPNSINSVCVGQARKKRGGGRASQSEQGRCDQPHKSRVDGTYSFICGVDQEFLAQAGLISYQLSLQPSNEPECLLLE